MLRVAGDDDVGFPLDCAFEDAIVGVGGFDERDPLRRMNDRRNGLTSFQRFLDSLMTPAELLYNWTLAIFTWQEGRVSLTIEGL